MLQLLVRSYSTNYKWRVTWLSATIKLVQRILGSVYVESRCLSAVAAGEAVAGYD